MNAKQQGFTLIELVVVIVILGILAAVAVPRFVGMQSDARFAVLQGVNASMQSVSSMVHAKSLALGIPNGNLPAGSVEGLGTIAVVNGYPTTANIIGLLNLQPAANFNTTVAGRVQIAGATTLGNCQVTYASATLVGGLVIPPVITVTNNTPAGCN